MNSKEAIKTVMKMEKYTQTRMAETLGYANQSNVAETLRNSSSMQIRTFCAMCNALGYEVTIQPVRKGRRPDGQIVIEEEWK